MKNCDCLLIRVSGELSLKSEQVREKFFSKLVRNLRKAMERESVKYRIETNPSRIFVFTEEIEKATKIAKNIFGVSSLSPCWTCFSGLDEIKLLVSDVAVENLKLDETKSFALRVRKAGRHRKFSARAIAEEVGAAVKRVTRASVDLTAPDTEIFIECRSRRTYVFTERIEGVGGFPLGTGARCVALVYSDLDLLAAWLCMRKGSPLIVLTDNEKYERILKSWHIGERIKVIYENFEGIESYLKKYSSYLWIHGSEDYALHSEKIVFANPIIALDEEFRRKMLEKIKEFEEIA